ncbi:MAG TPA: DUF4350 domain-containing protein [Fluviicoccus sp.]|nr:DUF4350 domain-containing protein [Fluviicoccus sp.]
MTLTRSAWLGLAVAALLLLAGALLFEVVPSRSAPKWSEEALKNPYLAAGRLLEGYGHVVRFQPEYDSVPGQPGALILTMPSGTVPAKDIEPLLDWVRGGNRLLIPAQYLGQEGRLVRDPLLSPLGVRLHDRELDNGDDDEEDSVSPDRRLLSPAASGWLETNFQARYRLEDTQDKAAESWADANGVHVLVYRVGDGRVIVVSEAGLWSNRAISYKDNAALLAHLLEGTPATGRISIVYGGDVPGILELLWRKAWQPLTTLAVLCLALVWFGNARFGPLLPSPDQPRRRLAEHLQAAGRYLWYAGRHDRLYQSVRQSLRQHAFRRHPHWRRLEDAALVAELHRHTGLDDDVIRLALTAAPARDLARFLHDMRTLNQLRKLT